jgi:hypothetical protein
MEIRFHNEGFLNKTYWTERREKNNFFLIYKLIIKTATLSNKVLKGISPLKTLKAYKS